MHIVINKWTVGPILAAIGLLVACFVKVAGENSWVASLELLAIAVISAVTFLFTDTVVEMFERDRPHAEWFQEPNTWVKVAAGVVLVYCTLKIYGVL